MRRIVSVLLMCVVIPACDILTPGGGGIEASFSGPMTETYQYESLTGGSRLSCVVTYNVQGTISVAFDDDSASKPGTVEIEWDQTVSGRTGTGCGNEGNNASPEYAGDLTGTPDDFRFAAERDSDVGPLSIRTTVGVTGGRTAEGATASISLSRSGSGVTGGSTAVTLSSSSTWAVTLR